MIGHIFRVSSGIALCAINKDDLLPCFEGKTLSKGDRVLVVGELKVGKAPMYAVLTKHPGFNFIHCTVFENCTFMGAEFKKSAESRKK